MNLSKKQFCRCMDAIKSEFDFWDKIDDLFGVVVEKRPPCLDVLIETLVALTGDFDEYSDVEYFIFELEFGTKWKPGMVVDNGKDIDLSTAEKLYDYITSAE